MQHDTCWSGGSRVRAVFGLAAMYVFCVAASPAAAQVTLTWIERDFIPNEVGHDKTQDIVHWEDPFSNDKFVYVTGYMRTTDGVTVIATIKFEADLVVGTQEVARAYYPPIPGEATGTHRGVAIDVDPVSGDIYVAAETLDENSINGYDYAVLKYNKNLVPHSSWPAIAPDPVGFRRYDGPAHGDDRPVDIVVVADPDFDHTSVAVTGTSDGGASGQDVMSLLYRADDGLFDDKVWAQIPFGGDPPGRRRYNESFNDRVVGIDWGYRTVAEELEKPQLYIAGTLDAGPPRGDDIFAILYKYGTVVTPLLGNGNPGWNGPEGGNDVATGIEVQGVNPEGFPQKNWLAVSGYSLHYDPIGFGMSPLVIADTDYIILNLSDDRWMRGFPGFFDMRMWNGPGPSSDKSDDFSTDIDIAVREAEPGVPGVYNAYAWITGRVRDAAGSKMDVGTIMYELHEDQHPDPPAREWTYTLGFFTYDGGVAIDAVDDTLAEIAFVAAYTNVFSWDFLLLHYNRVSGLQTLWAWYDAHMGTDLLTSLVAPDPTTVFITGESHDPITLRDYLTLRYDDP